MIFPRPYDKDVWSDWFAWYPIKIAGYYVWLEVVRRRKYGSQWRYFSIRLNSKGVDQ